jgi:hypothetical protein
MNEIKSQPVKSLSVGDVFTFDGFGPYVVSGVTSEAGKTVVRYRGMESGKPTGGEWSFVRPSLSTVCVFDRLYGPELYQS